MDCSLLSERKTISKKMVGFSGLDRKRAMPDILPSRISAGDIRQIEFTTLQLQHAKFGAYRRNLHGKIRVTYRQAFFPSPYFSSHQQRMEIPETAIDFLNKRGETWAEKSGDVANLHAGVNPILR